MRLPSVIRTLSWREIFLRLASLVIAIGIWAAVLGSKKEEFLKSYELTYKFGIERTHSNEVPNAIQVKLFGPKAFVRAVTQKHFAPILVDLSQAPIGTSYVEVNPEEVPVPMGVKAIEITPGSIPIRIEREIVKELPLKIEVQGRVKEGFQIKALYVGRTEMTDPTVVAPEVNRVRIRGAQSVLTAANSIKTRPVNLEGLQGNGELPIELDLDGFPGVKLDGEAPPLRYEVVAIEGSFKLRSIPIEVLTNHRFALDVPEATIIVKATASTIAGLKSRGIVAKVNLVDKNKGKYREKVEVTVPKEITVIRVVPATVNVLLY